MTNEEKLTFAKYALTQKIESIDMWEDFKNIIASASPASIRAFIVNKLQERAQSLRDSAAGGEAVATDIDNLILEL